jgi:hypothetical protein
MGMIFRRLTKVLTKSVCTPCCTSSWKLLPFFFVFFNLCQEALKGQLVARMVALGTVEDVQVPPTSIISSENSLPIFDQSKGSLSRFRIKKDINKGESPQMDPQLENRLVYEERLKAAHHGRVGTSVEDISIRLSQR